PGFFAGVQRQTFAGVRLPEQTQGSMTPSGRQVQSYLPLTTGKPRRHAGHLQAQRGKVMEGIPYGNTENGEQQEGKTHHQIVLVIDTSDEQQQCQQQEEKTVARGKDENALLAEDDVLRRWQAPCQPALVPTPPDRLHDRQLPTT